ncbi:5'-nucleotidase [Streptomyces anulatus]|uniref:5'-nucleotidase n=1 Tax=Streptomyces anulatus TaxID=1892 RepID=UPI000AC1EB3F|nr:5'-nucleotidase [Streptomyces anulatus]
MRRVRLPPESAFRAAPPAGAGTAVRRCDSGGASASGRPEGAPYYELADRLVIGIASSALFDLTESDAVFREQGEESYRAHQEQQVGDPLRPGSVFPFIRRLLSLNDLSEVNDPLVEVIVLSRNDPDTGLRVMRSMESHDLPISRAIFMQGRSPHRFMPALNMSLFLSANERDVREAVAAGLPAGHVFDDQHGHLESTSRTTPSVHVPFGKLDEPAAPAARNA